MFVKLMTGALFIASGTLFGHMKARRLSGRYELIGKIINSLEYMKNEIYYTRDRLEKIALRTGQRTDGEVSAFFMKFADNLTDNQEIGISDIWEECAMKIFSSGSCLDRKDLDAFKALGFKLGQTDVTGQCSNIERTVRELAIRRNEAADDVSSKSRMYKTAGTAVGAVCAIMIF